MATLNVKGINGCGLLNAMEQNLISHHSTVLSTNNAHYEVHGIYQIDVAVRMIWALQLVTTVYQQFFSILNTVQSFND